MSERFDVAIVGAGVLGLAHAYHFAKAGLRVGVFERGIRATGASIRNFGMIWPIGQPPGEMRDIALRSREIWLEILRASGIWHERCGSLHLAYEDDELAVLAEFAAKALDYQAAILSPEQTLARCPHLRAEGLRGALHSQSELCVFPRQVISELPAYLQTLGVTLHFGTAVTSVGPGLLVASGREVRADRIVLCIGDDFETLFPDRIRQLGLTRSKLQMLRARPSSGYRLGTHLCAGLTLGHYQNFRICESLAPLLERFEKDWPKQVAKGIHLLVSQHEDGALTIGDSHEYGLDLTPFRDEEIDRLMLAYLDTFLDTHGLEIEERWYGVYAKHPTKPYIVDSPCDGVTIVTGVGGAGMTLSFGLAAQVVEMLTFAW